MTIASRLLAATILGSGMVMPVFAEDMPQAADPGITPTQVATPNPTAGPRAPINTTGKTVDLMVPLRDRVPMGQVAIRISPEDHVSVSVTDVAAAVSRSVTPQYVERLKATPTTDGFAPIEAFAASGFPLAFDSGTLELSLVMDPSMRPEQSVNFGFANDQSEILPDVGEPFSLFVNYQASIDFVEKGLDKGLKKPRVNFEVNGRMFNLLSFENELSYDGEALQNKFSRFGSRMIYDRPGSLLRFTVGDLLPITTSYQDSVDVLGLGVSKLPSAFRPDRLFTATAGRRITLREAANVTLIVNGIPSRTIRLQPGSFSLQDLPLVGGANRVDLLIEDDAGGRQTVSFDFFDDVDLLADGVDEFDANVGFRSFYDNGKRDYFFERPVFSGFYRRGITSQFTLGANAQLAEKAQQAGLRGDLGTPVGLFSLEGAFSRHDDFGSGHAIRLQYRYSRPIENLAGVRRVDVLVEKRSRDFAGIETMRPSNPYSWSINARYSQPINFRLTAGFSGEYRTGRGGNVDRYAFRANATYRVRDNISLTASAGYERGSGVVVGATLFWRLGRSDTITAQYDSRYDDTSASYFHSPTRLLDTVAYGVEARRTDGNLSMNGTATWRTNRGDLEIAHRAGIDGDTDQTTSLRARGTIALAGDKVAAGRYLTDSFAIVSAHPSLDGAKVYVGGRIADNAEARADALGPALVPVSSYSKRTVFYNVPDAPAGYDLGSGTSDIYPWLHSGKKITVGSDYFVTIFGNLLNDRGEPVPLVEGTATKIGDPNAPTVPIFTNREGRLGASGLGKGQWQIKAGPYTYIVDIKPEDGAYIDFKALRPVAPGEVKP